MSNKENQTAPADEAVKEAVSESEQVVENTEEAEENVEMTEVETLQSALAEAEAKVAENWAHFLSAKAEADNIQKRAVRDVSNAHKYALEKFIPELLAVKDSLELGVKAAKESISETPNEQMTQFVEGSEMAVNMFNESLKKVGVEVVNPEGELFNAEFHQAMTMVPNEALPANSVIEVIQKGYTLNERLLRPAMVIVSKKP